MRVESAMRGEAGERHNAYAEKVKKEWLWGWCGMGLIIVVNLVLPCWVSRFDASCMLQKNLCVIKYHLNLTKG